MPAFLLLAAAVSALDVSITQPEDGGSYGVQNLVLRVLVENDDVLPDSVTFSLNGEAFTQVPRLDTDWHTYMQNPVHNGLSLSPAPLTNEVLWTAPVTGFIHEFPNPIIVDGIVYYPSDSGDLKLHALDAATGEEIWSYAMMGSDDPPSYSAGCVFIASDSVYCIDALTGERIWAFVNAEEDFRAGSTPCVMEGRVACAGNKEPAMESTVYCLSAGDGEVLWERPLQGRVMNCIAGWNGMFFVGTWHGPLHAIDAATGEIVWSSEIVNDGFWDTSPCIVDGNLFIGGEDACLHRFDAMTGSLDWSVFLGDRSEPTPAVFGETVICGHTGFLSEPGCLAAVNMADGSIAWWIEARIHGSPAVADGVVFWGGAGGIEGDNRDIYAADAATGEMIWSYNPDAGWLGLQSTPAITDGVMYYAATDGNLYAFGTGLKWTYLDDLLAGVGENELVASSWSSGAVAASDTVHFTVTETGIETGPAPGMALSLTPNPFTATTQISFSTELPGFASVRVFALSGQLVRTLADGEMPAGERTLVWDARDAAGRVLPPGVYLLQVSTPEEVVSKSLCLLR